MHYHILLTEKCNSECKYCYEKSMKEFDNGLDKKFKFDFSSPESTQVNVQKLKEFLARDKKAVLVFYGGEPLLEIDMIRKIMDKIDVPFYIQTNGKLLNELAPKYVNRFQKILVSIDGSRKRTDHNKGNGTYDLVMDNIHYIKKKGFKGEIIARMTISQEFPDLYEQVLNLLDAGFKSIHWQLDAGFFKFDFDYEKFSTFAKIYNRNVSDLIDLWISEMKQGRVIKLYPFIGIVNSLLKAEKTKLRCGAGYAGYAITTDGKIVACPIMNCIEDFKAGDLDSNPEHLKKFDVTVRCLKCEYHDLCGGRCLYWNQAGLWPKEGDELICKTIKHLIDELKERMPVIESLISKGIIKKSFFDYEKYFGPEIIP